MVQIKKHHALLSLGVTSIIILLLIIGPAKALTVLINNINGNTYETGDVIDFTISVTIQTDELIPLQYNNITITFPDSTTKICKILNDKTVIGCDELIVHDIDFDGLDYIYGNATGYDNPTWYDLGYGYGYVNTTTNSTLTYNLSLDTSCYPLGSYDLDSIIFAGIGTNTHIFQASQSTFQLNCTVPTNGAIYDKSRTFCSGTYNLNNGVTFTADNICINCNGTTLKDSDTIDSKGIYLDHVDNSIIDGCQIKDYYDCILFYVSKNNTVKNTNLTSCRYGLRYSEYSGDNTAHNNQISSNMYGIEIYFANGNIFFNNNIFNNDYGVRDESSWITFFHNNVTNNDFGLLLHGTANGTIYENNIYNHNWENIDTTIDPPPTIELSLNGSGNYWGSCTDSNNDTFCDGNYTAGLAQDSYPYSSISGWP